MAKLKNLNTLEEIHLLPEHIFGRYKERSHTHLNYPKASRLQAFITWHDQNWHLKDVSTNGTFLNSKRIERGLKAPLVKNDIIHFADIHTSPWQILDTTAPSDMLTPLSPNLQPILLDKLTALPKEDKPIVILYINSQGDWMCESSKETTCLRNGSLVIVGNGQVWRFNHATPLAETSTEAQLNPHHNTTSPNITIEVSQDEEHISVSLSSSSTETFDLGEKAHHQLLLELARKRLSDQEDKLAERDQGWIDRGLIANRLGIDDNHLTQQLYRARKQFEQHTKYFPRLQSILASRPNEVRLDHNLIRILGGNIKQQA